jgi:hypothetical protein
MMMHDQDFMHDTQNTVEKAEFIEIYARKLSIGGERTERDISYQDKYKKRKYHDNGIR